MLPLTFSTLRVSNVIRCEREFNKINDWSPSDWSNAAAGEIGETCNLTKKMLRLETINNAAVMNKGIEYNELKSLAKKEIGDTVVYLDLLAARLGLTLEECVKEAFNEVSDRVSSDIRL